MKIKKVEISAFRAFNKKEDATFDFTHQDGEVADFISIYGPNGFGKTSFYDAVEWCITNKLSRFSRLSVQNEKSLHDLKRQNEPNVEMFIRNKDATVDQQTFVKLITDRESKEDVIYRNIVDLKYRYEFNNEGIEQGYFTNVILAQDTINSFLKEEKPEERYNRFVSSFPQLKTSNEALQNFRSLININDETIRDLLSTKKDLETRQQELYIPEDNKTIKEINETVKKLTTFGEDFDETKKLESSNIDLESLSIKLSQRIPYLEIEIKEGNKLINDLDLAYNGNATTKEPLGVVEYFTLKSKTTVENEELKWRINFKNKFILNSQVQNLIKEISKLNASKKELVNIIGKYSQFENTENRITELTRNTAETFKRNLKDIEVKIEDTLASIDASDLKLLPYYDFKRKLEIGIDSIKEHDVSRQNKDIIESLIQNVSLLEKLRSDLITTQKAIDFQTSLEQELKSFFSKGIELINRPEFEKRCPLCTQLYVSKEELAGKILNNNLLSQSLKILLNQKNATEIKITETKNKIEESKAGIDSFYLPTISQNKNSVKELDTLREARGRILNYLKILDN